MACRLAGSHIVILLISLPQASMVTHPCNYSTLDAVTGSLQVPSHYGLQSKALSQMNLMGSNF